MLLLLDLDGVLVSDGGGDTRVGKEILCIHPELQEYLRKADIPVAVLTHRSRREASQIIQALNLDKIDLLEIFTANDIAFCKPTAGRLLSLIRRGARKSRIIPYIQARWKIDPATIVFVDDREENIVDMTEAGIGLGIHVPAARFLVKTRTVITFDLQRLFAEIQYWRDSQGALRAGRIISMNPIQVPQESAMFTGVIMNESGIQVFKQVRRLRRLFKSGLRWLNPRWH